MSQKNQKAFTIVEVLVTVAIITVSMAISIASFPKIKLQLSLARTAYTFAEDIKLAQQMSSSGVPYKNTTGTQLSIDGYGVYANISGSSGSLGNKAYLLFADGSPGDRLYDTTHDYQVKYVNLRVLEPGIVIKEVNNVTSKNIVVDFDFSKIEPSLYLLDVGKTSIEYVFALESDLSVIKKVVINTSGLVEIKPSGLVEIK